MGELCVRQSGEREPRVGLHRRIRAEERLGGAPRRAAVRHGWYINVEEFLPQLISEEAEHFRRGGLEAILEFYSDPRGITESLTPTAEYYNSTDTLDGYFSGFIAAPDGEILAHIDPALNGTDIEDLLGPAVRNATPDGAWITADDNPAEAGGPQTMRIWAIDVDGTFIGAGWYRT